jgi:hypothetical protein
MEIIINLMYLCSIEFKLFENDKNIWSDDYVSDLNKVSGNLCIVFETQHSGLDFIKIGKKIRIFFLGHLYSFPI